MPQLRFIVAWLIMLALPLQGLAAAAMTYCAGADAHAHAQQAVEVAHAAAHDTHDHAAHGHAPAGAAQDSLDEATESGLLPDAAHKCGVCASCCHTVAIVGTDWAVVVARIEQADLVDPFVRFDAILSPLPDKPPRA